MPVEDLRKPSKPETTGRLLSGQQYMKVLAERAVYAANSVMYKNSTPLTSAKRDQIRSILRGVVGRVEIPETVFLSFEDAGLLVLIAQMDPDSAHRIESIYSLSLPANEGRTTDPIDAVVVQRERRVKSHWYLIRTSHKASEKE